MPWPCTEETGKRPSPRPRCKTRRTRAARRLRGRLCGTTSTGLPLQLDVGNLHVGRRQARGNVGYEQDDVRIVDGDVGLLLNFGQNNITGIRLQPAWCRSITRSIF